MVTIDQITEEVKERFWAKVNKTEGCWLWTGAKNEGGYGLFRLHGRRAERTHRLSWVLHNGPIAEGLFVCHKCDNPPCCNPSHLFIGTTTDNMRDAVAKGRMATGARNGAFTHPECCPRTSNPGEQNGRAKLTEEQIQEIRMKYVPGTYTQKMLAKEYSVAQNLIFLIVTRKIWKHVA